jgi:hypothetical protein
VLTGYGRDDDTDDEIVVELTEAGYVHRGDRDHERARSLTETILGLLPGAAPGLSYHEIVGEWPGGHAPRKQALLDALREGAEAQEPLWRREGEGIKGSPFTFWRDPFPDSVSVPFPIREGNTIGHDTDEGIEAAPIPD